MNRIILHGIFQSNFQLLEYFPFFFLNGSWHFVMTLQHSPSTAYSVTHVWRFPNQIANLSKAPFRCVYAYTHGNGPCHFQWITFLFVSDGTLFFWLLLLLLLLLLLSYAFVERASVRACECMCICYIIDNQIMKISSFTAPSHSLAIINGEKRFCDA